MKMQDILGKFIFFDTIRIGPMEIGKGSNIVFEL